ncbi:MAG: helicase [Veloxivirus ubatis]|uniref:Replication-associated protein n=1 Tax=Cressdnaviricota sp. TaxID=2748378 RepID=A0A385E5G0_9VIRU|nr:MAG: helicase [Cressdnaviricota sp.]
MGKHCGFAFTDYVMDLSFYQKLCDNPKVRYMIVGKEITPTTGREHGQGYIYYENERSVKSVEKEFDGRHVEAMYHKSWPGANKTYCEKDNNLLWDYGVCPAQGVRKDIHQLKAQVADSSETLSEVIWNHCHKYQDILVVEKLFKYKKQKRKIEPIEVIWIHGPPGCGKTRYVYDRETDPFRPISEKWWDGYEGQQVILLDDFREDWCKFARLLQLTDIYPFKVETKGGSVEVMYKKVYITSPYNHKHTFSTVNEEISQLTRRITSEINMAETNGGDVA